MSRLLNFGSWKLSSPDSAAVCSSSSEAKRARPQTLLFTKRNFLGCYILIYTGGMASWQQITRFNVDLGDSSEAFVTVQIRLVGVEIKNAQEIHCSFRRDAVDLQVLNLKGQDWRFFRDDLQNDIDPDLSSFSVRKNHVVLRLCKKSNGPGYEEWTDLLAVAKPKRRRCEEADGVVEAADALHEVHNFLSHLHHHGDDELQVRVQQCVVRARGALSTASP